MRKSIFCQPIYFQRLTKFADTVFFPHDFDQRIPSCGFSLSMLTAFLGCPAGSADTRSRVATGPAPGPQALIAPAPQTFALTPRATWLSDRPLLSSRSTASRRNSSVYAGFVDGIVSNLSIVRVLSINSGEFQHL